MIKNERLQAVPTMTSLGVEQTIGLGIVLKSTLLKELLESATRTIRESLAQHKPEATTETRKIEQSDAKKATAS